MSKAKNFINFVEKNMSEYSWSNPALSYYYDVDNDTDIDDEDQEYLDGEDCDCDDEESCIICDPEITQDMDTPVDFDDLEEQEDYPSSLFPEPSYNNISRYYNQMLDNPDNLVSRSCQMCGQNEKMHGVRFCRSCYDRMRYKRRKILGGSFKTLVPFHMNKSF